MNAVDSRSDTRRGTLQRTVQSSGFFWANLRNLAIFFSENEKKLENFVTFGDFSAIFRESN
jgi:hypothetical protein